MLCLWLNISYVGVKDVGVGVSNVVVYMLCLDEWIFEYKFIGSEVIVFQILGREQWYGKDYGLEAGWLVCLSNKYMVVEKIE